ncbi:sigma-70 family RNA polymerase sigma factor [Amycolatopsis sp. NBC_00345]|uniref:sigma-70 family RNA polymerase sigma factor n=1 Tax=Amycolatopsis sp. NBC_00345 TaxID=2975955 RepID=UPI002E27706B
MSTVPADLSGKSDAELIAEVRAGEIASYGTLFERHSGAAYNLARQLARSSAEADDLVSEAFAKVLDTLRGGKGPDTAFRAYLLTALRHTAYDKTRRDRRVDLNEDMSDAGGAIGEALTVPFSDTAVAGLERTMAAKAFARLPERWQAVLWHTEIEQQSPAEVAPLLGLTANGVSALAYRAREGLRQAYLQVHLQENNADRCRAAADRLGAWTRDGLSKRERSQVENHLDECEACRALAAELADVNGGLRAIIAPIVLGGAALGYLATIGAAKAGAATAATAGAAAVTSGAAAAGGAKAGAAAAASAPRQFAGVAVSGAAIVAAVAIALASSGSQEIPVAAQVPPPAAAPAAPPPKPAPPAAPAVPAPPAPPAAQPAPPPVPPPAAPAQPAPPPPAAPAPAKMSATTPSGDLELQPGAGPVNLPITVRNDGGSLSDPVQVALNLPAGVSAVPVGGGGAVSAFRADSAGAQTQAAPLAVNCPGGTGTVTCKTGSGLQPGQTAVLTFRLLADESAKGGTVTGSVTAGTALKVTVSVKVTVKTPPPDAVLLQADTDGLSAFPWTRNPLVYVRVRNTGETTKPVTVTFDHAIYQSWSLSGFPCESTGSSATCTTRGSLAPDQHVNLWVRLDGRPTRDTPVTVSATLGKAEAKPVQLFFGCWLGICDVPYPTTGSPEPSEKPTNSPGTSTSPSKPKKHPSPSSTPPAQPADPTTTAAPGTPSTSTSAPPDPGSGNSGKPGQTPPTIEPRGFFDWLRG